jgi:non-canonical poly(A) RNA polymerase PAPD5/7
MSTKLYLPTSDVDIVILGVPQDKRSFQRLEVALRQAQCTSYLEAILHARVPIIKLTDKVTTFAVDLTIGVEGGPESAEWFVKEMARRPMMRPLILLIKYFLYSRGLHETYHGGIGSFALQLMVLSYLQLHPSRNDKHFKKADTLYTLGAQLVSFLSYYGKEFNYVKVGISVRDQGSLFLKARAPTLCFLFLLCFFDFDMCWCVCQTAYDWFDPNRPFLLCMENPLDTSMYFTQLYFTAYVAISVTFVKFMRPLSCRSAMDVGKNSYNIAKVRKAFEVAHTTLLALPTSETASLSLLSRIVRFIAQLCLPFVVTCVE